MISNIWHDISPSRIQPEDSVAVIEVPKGSEKKHKPDKEIGFIIPDRVLHTSTHYPVNYGFIPRTYGGDGDPLDMLVLCSEEIDPLIPIRCYPIGYISMLDGGRNGEKVIAIPFFSPTYNLYRDLMDLSSHPFDEMKHFFPVYKALEGKQAAVKDVNDWATAVQVVRQAMDHYAGCFLGDPSTRVGLYPTEPDRPTAPERKGKQFQGYLNGMFIPFPRNPWCTVSNTRKERTIPHESSV